MSFFFFKFEGGEFFFFFKTQLFPSKQQKRNSPGDRGLDPVVDAEEALGRALARAELPVDRVDVRRQQPGAERVGARDQDRRHARDVGGEARGDERADKLGGGDEDLAAEVAALLLRGELVLEVDARGACEGRKEKERELEGREKGELFERPPNLALCKPKKKKTKNKKTHRPQSCSSSSRSS